MTGRFKQALLEMKKSKKGRKGKMPKNFSVSSGDKSKAGGLTAKGVKRYRAANPGSKLKTAVTTKPSKLKKGSKSAKRRNAPSNLRGRPPGRARRAACRGSL